MRTFDVRISAAVTAVLALLACGEKESPRAESPQAAQAQPTPAASAPAPATPAAAAPAPAPPPKADTPAAPVAPPPATPAPVVKPAPAPAPRTEPAAPPAKPSPPAAASAHAKVGADKCKMCHRVQHQSWAARPHAAKGLDCEGCHGNGGDYWPASVMRDRAKAAAAGLVTPTLASCKKCHGAKADAALFARVHAHDEK
jgi:hypothetical protein